MKKKKTKTKMTTTASITGNKESYKVVEWTWDGKIGFKIQKYEDGIKLLSFFSCIEGTTKFFPSSINSLTVLGDIIKEVTENMES